MIDPIIPSMWREELFHPFLAHLPIVLIPLTLGFRLGAHLFSKRPSWAFLLPASRLVLPIAAIGAWAALYSGGIAEDVVNQVICDPTVTHEHEEFAEWTTYLMTLAVMIDLLQIKLSTPRWKWLQAVTLLVLITCMGLIIRTAHLGASLVYQQGAGVYHPTPECKEFE